MAVSYLFDPVKQFVSRNGIPLAGGFLNVYIGESQEPAPTYSDAEGTVLNPRDIPIDSVGRAPGVFVDDSKIYTLKAYNAGRQLQFTIYPVYPVNSSGGGGSEREWYYYSGDDYVHIDQDAREISLTNLKSIRGDEDTIQMYDSNGELFIRVNPDIIGSDPRVSAGRHTSVDYNATANTYTVNAEFTGSDTIGIDSDGEVHGKYDGGYGIDVSGNVIKNKHHVLIATEDITYGYCKVFDMEERSAYGQGHCVFTSTNALGEYAAFGVAFNKAPGAHMTNVSASVVSANPPSMATEGFIESLEIRSVGDRFLGYLKLRNFSNDHFWLDWQGFSECGDLSFTPQLTNSPEGFLLSTEAIDENHVFYSKQSSDSLFQRKLTAGENITIDSDGVISADEGDSNVFIATYGPTTYSEVAEAIGYGKSVVLRIIDDQDTTLGAMYGGHFVSPSFDGFYFFSMGVSGYRKIYRVNSNNVWSKFVTDETGGKVFFAEYGSTLFSEVKNAIFNGMLVVARISGETYFTLDHDYDDHIVFTGKMNNTAYVDNFAEVDSDNRWTMSEAAIANTTFTAHGSVTTTDNYNDVGSTFGFKVGQKGTHGGQLDIGVKITANGWGGAYKAFTRIYHNLTQSGVPASGSASFEAVTLTTDYARVGFVSQYLLTSSARWTAIIELAYAANPGRTLRLTLSGVGSGDITYFAEEVR